MKVSLHNIYHQYLIGLVINLSFVGLLYSFQTSRDNLQIPIEKYQNNIWQVSDVLSYVKPAMNYINYGVFGNKYVPDHYRTIGYPALISFFLYLFGKNWLIALLIFQCIAFALIYPLNTVIAKEIFPEISNRLISSIFIFSVLSGTYFTGSTLILTDTLFVLFLTMGLYLGLKAFSPRENYLLLFLGYVASITVAALIRPTLAFFPVVNLAIIVFVLRQSELPFRIYLKRFLVTTLIFAFTCNLSVVRNYVNYAYLSPASITWEIYLKFMTCKILMSANKSAQYQTYLREAEAMTDISTKSEFSKHIMQRTMMQYPVITLKVLFANAINICLDNHLINNVANYFGYNWKAYRGSGTEFSPASPYSANSPYPFKRSMFCYYATYAMMLLYFILWLALLVLTYNFTREKKYEYVVLIALLLLVFVIPAILTGNGGSRYRLPFDSFLTLFSFYQISKITAGQSFKMYLLSLFQSWRQGLSSWTFSFPNLIVKWKAGH